MKVPLAGHVDGYLGVCECVQVRVRVSVCMRERERERTERKTEHTVKKRYRLLIDNF